MSHRSTNAGKLLVSQMLLVLNPHAKWGDGHHIFVGVYPWSSNFRSRFGSRFLLHPALSCWATSVLSIDVSSVCSFGKRSQWKHFNYAVLQSRGLEDFGPDVASIRTPEACHRRRAHFGRPFSLVDAQLEDQDCLTAVALQATVAGTRKMSRGAFALWCCGESRIVTWGHPDGGGDSSAVWCLWLWHEFLYVFDFINLRGLQGRDLSLADKEWGITVMLRR